MDFAFDYNSISEQYFKMKEDLEESFNSLKKLSSYKDYALSGNKKRFSKPLEKIASEKISSKNKRQLLKTLEKSPKEGISSKPGELCDSSESEVSQSDSDEESQSDSDKESQSDNDSDRPSKKACLQSAVITRVESSKTRKNFIRSYTDNKVQLRNRRFLGMVQNTLQKFKDEEVRRKPQDLKRKKAIEKVEAAVEEEKNSVKKQKEELLAKTRQQQLELQCLGKMMSISESFELWEKNQEYLLNFIATETEPKIFFLPTSFSATAKKKLERSRMKVLEETEKQKAFVRETLSKIRQSYTDLAFHASTEEKSLLSEVDSFQNVSKTEQETDEDTKGSETILHLDLSESECEDFY